MAVTGNVTPYRLVASYLSFKKHVTSIVRVRLTAWLQIISLAGKRRQREAEVAQLVMKHSAIYGTQGLPTVVKKVPLLTLLRHNIPVQTLSHPTPVRSFLKLRPPPLYSCVSVGLNKALQAPPVSPTRKTRDNLKNFCVQYY
jgi:hypothetical protein